MGTVVVTGGTSGIGLGVVKDLLASTSHNVVSISRNVTKITQVRGMLSEYSDRIEFYSADITNVDSVEKVFEEVTKKCDEVCGLVNSAGIIRPGGIECCSLESWNETMNANITGTFIVSKVFLPLLKKSSEKKQQASIVNISSICSLRGGSSISYSTSKAATDMFTKCLALELSKYNIRVNAVNPGVVVSNLQLSAGIVKDEGEYEEFLQRMKTLHPLGRNGLPEDVASTVTFLLSEKTSWVTGAIISVDGGRSVL